jgi:hypothetical protein
VEISLISRGFDVVSVTPGETGVTYHVRVRTLRKPTKHVDIRSEAMPGTVLTRPLVTFSSTTPHEWPCSLTCSAAAPGSDHHPVTVDQTTGDSILRAVDLVLTDPLGQSKETLSLDLTVTVQ